jgi:type III pantothenate kinase
MTSRALLFDVGNTRLKWGVFDGDQLSRTGSVRHEALKESGFSQLNARLPRDVDHLLVCNVAGPGFAARLSSFVGIHCGAEMHFAKSERNAFGITNAYRQPRRLGVDRWVAMIGARAESKSALCVVDAGTALTIDALDGSGQHLGGQIIPGLRLMARALQTETSDIGAPAKSASNTAAGMGLFADNTRQAVQTGALTAVCGAIERAVRIMRAEGLRPKIILTGGDSSRILTQLDGKVLHRPHLVLQGLALMLQDKFS